MAQFSGQDLLCIRKQSVVFEGLSFTVKQGQTLALTGSNGSGKTSLLRLMAGLLEPKHGALYWKSTEEADTEEADMEFLQEQMHWIGPNNPLKPELTVRENLQFWYDLMTKGSASGHDREQALTLALCKINVTQLKDTQLRYLSAGQVRRVNLCRLFLAKRPLWLLDEPATGLDKDTAQTLAGLVKDHTKDKGIAIIATHRPDFWTPDETLNIRERMK